VGGLPRGENQAVDGVQRRAHEAAQAQLLPAGQPAVQPTGEAVVLGAAPQLEERGAHAGQVDQRQRHQGDGGEGGVDGLDGHLVEDALPCRDVGLQDVAQEVVRVEEGEQAQGAEGGEAPGGEEAVGEVLDLQGGGEEAHVDGDEAHAAAELHHRALGRAAVAAQQNLERDDDDGGLRRSRKSGLFLLLQSALPGRGSYLPVSIPRSHLERPRRYGVEPLDHGALREQLGEPLGVGGPVSVDARPVADVHQRLAGERRLQRRQRGVVLGEHRHKHQVGQADGLHLGRHLEDGDRSG